MKKLIYCALALAAALFATSCQQENLEPVQGGNTVTFTVEIPEVATKAEVVDDGTNIDNLVYAVYRTDANNLAEAAATIDPKKLVYRFNEYKSFTEEGNTNVTLELINNQKYIVLFWAQVYDTWVTGKDFDLTNITYPNKLVANDSKYAAFSGAAFVEEVKGARNEKVTLTRPFAQINLATSDPTNYSVAIDSSSVKIENVYSKFNVATMKAYGEFRTVEYAANARPDGNFEDYDYYVAMNYIFANPQNDGTTPVKVTCTIDTEEHGTGIVKEISNVPVAQNYRTNIVGNLLTSDVDYEVQLNNEWFTPDKVVEVVSVSTADELQEAIKNIAKGTEGNIKLEGVIDLSNLASLVSTKSDETTEPAHPDYGLQIPEDKTLVLDLNGFTLSQTVECKKHYSMIKNSGNLTILDSKVGGTISFKDKGKGDPNFGWGSYTIENHGNLVVNSGTIEHTGEQNTVEANVHMYCAIHQNNPNAVTTINGGTISTPTYRSIRICSGTANINGGHMDGQAWVHPFAEGIVLNIEGGEFKPNGGDYSSVFVENSEKDVTFTVTGGFFNTKIGASVPENLAGTVKGGTFTASAKENTYEDLYYGYMFVQNGENFVLEQCPVKIGDSVYYETLTEAVAAVQEGETITILAGKILSEGTIKLPATLKNVTFVGEEGATLKDMTISAADGNSYNYEGLTFDGITFDNSRVVLTGWRNGEETIKNLTVTNCVFKNLYDETNSAPVHINKEANEAVNGFTFTNNVIDGATGGSKSGIYAQLTGEILVSGNVINNVSFRPFVIQVTIDDNVADNFIVRNNTFSGSAVGRAQGLGNTAEGTDTVNLEVKENIFKGITDSQQICYWNFNPAKTTADLSYNYYDIDILENPGKIYFNSAAADVYDLVDMGVFPIYTDENKTTTFSPEVNAAKIGETEYATLQEAFNVGGEITLLCNVTVAETVVLAEGKTVVLDLDGKTLKGTMHKSVGAVVKNEGTMTVKNGTISSTADNGGSAIQNAGTLEVENAVLNGAKNADGSWPSYTVNNTGSAVIENTKITSYHGAVASYNDNAIVTLNNSEIAMVGIPGFTNHGIYTYNNGCVVVNGGTYVNNAKDQASTGGSVINGAVTVNAGTFSGRIENYSGTPVLKGGTYSVEPNENFVDKDYKIIKDGNVWNVVPKDYVAEVGDKKYESLQDAFKVGGEITLLRDVVLGETVVLAEGKTAVLDLNGKTLSHAEEANKYAINNHGTLTITGNGTVNARGIYNGYNDETPISSAKLTIENGTFNAKGTNGGAAVYNYGEVIIQGGEFESNGGYGLNNQSGAQMTLNNASVRGGIYISGATINVENSTIYQHLSGKHCIYNWSGNVIIKNGSFDSESGNELILADGIDASVTLNGGTYNKTAKSWLLGAATGKNITFVINGGTYNGYVNRPENTVDTIRPYGDPIIVKGGEFNFDPTNWLHDDFQAVKDGAKWIVQSK